MLLEESSVKTSCKPVLTGLKENYIPKSTNSAQTTAIWRESEEILTPF